MKIGIPLVRCLLAVIPILVVATISSCAGGSNSRATLNDIVAPFRFSTLRWSLDSLGQGGEEAANSAEVVRYFQLGKELDLLQNQVRIATAGSSQSTQLPVNTRLDAVLQERSLIEPGVQAEITRQIEQTLVQLGICSSIGKLHLIFPPVNFRLAEPPFLLAVSPLDKIELREQITLKQGMTQQEMEELESKVDALGQSSLVLELGGYGGAYPTFVSDEGGMEFTIETAVHEWVHQYLGFRPLGFRYVLDGLGIKNDYDSVTINETVADIVASEITTRLLDTYYPDFQIEGGKIEDGQSIEDPDSFDFDVAMREIRRNVDTLLAHGKINEAGTYMEEQRQFLLTKGYYLRKLNQAYFAFNGIYADSPTSVDPIGSQLRQLRGQSTSLREFLDTISRITSRNELQTAIK